MRRSAFSGYVAFSLRESERARLSRLARRFGYTQMDRLALDLFQIGLTACDASWAPVSEIERLARRRLSVRGRYFGPLEGIE
jgi:hypothetical protein